MNRCVMTSIAGMCTCILLSGCAATSQQAADDDMAAAMIERMDAAPPDERVPHWDHIRALMMREAPSVGDVAPDFQLEKMDGTGTIRLSEFESARPVVLIFGSWT